MKQITHNKNGFSMIEVMLVVAIVGVMVTLAISSNLALSVQQQKKTASHEISALITQARFMARGTSTPATITLNTVSASPGGSVTASIGAPVNWTQTITLGNGGNHTAVGLVNVQTTAGPFSITPRGTLSPAGFTLTLQDKNYSENGEEVLIQVGLLGDITIQ